MNKTIVKILFQGFILFALVNLTYSYPFDGYKLTGIRRLERIRLIIEGKLKGTIPVAGACYSVDEIKLNLVHIPKDSLLTFPPPDPELQKKVNALFPNKDESYSLALLDISPNKPIRFAARQIRNHFSPGSVSKLAIAAGLFTELQRIYPESIKQRQDLLRTRMVVADTWIHVDTHGIPIFDPETKSYTNRPARDGDVFSLYEWVDHMLSASANSAGSIVWKEAMLMRAFGNTYPPTPEQEREFFTKTPKSELGAIAMSTVNDPLRVLGIDEMDWKLGSFFTSNGKKIVPGSGGSVATPYGILKFLIALEKGAIVDPWSSLEIKRLMYMTARRIRYASSPALTDAAVYFKSGSLYRCKSEPDFTCQKYMGNVENVMNSVAIVEHDSTRVYLVALMSNVLKKNSAVEHQSLATFIDRALAK